MGDDPLSTPLPEMENDDWVDGREQKWDVPPNPQPTSFILLVVVVINMGWWSSWLGFPSIPQEEEQSPWRLWMQHIIFSPSISLSWCDKYHHFISYSHPLPILLWEMMKWWDVVKLKGWDAHYLLFSLYYFSLIIHVHHQLFISPILPPFLLVVDIHEPHLTAILSMVFEIFLHNP